MRSDKLFRSLCLGPSLVLKSPKDKDCITSLYNLPHCLTFFGVKRFLLLSRLSLSCSKFWPLSPTLPPCLSFQTLMFSWPPHKYLGAAIRPPKFPFSSSSLPRASAPSWNSLQFASVSYWPRDPKLDPWFQSHKGWGELQITPMDILACCSWCRPRCSCISLQPGHTADSQHPPGHLQAPASPSQQRCSKAAPPHQSGPSRYQLRDCSFPALTLGISLL